MPETLPHPSAQTVNLTAQTDNRRLSRQSAQQKKTETEKQTNSVAFSPQANYTD
jgi:hypothetical protein